jgi:thioredoxin 1
MSASRKTRPAKCLEVLEADFEQAVLKSPVPVAVAFWSPWSRPCQIMRAAVEAVAAACGTAAKVVKINADNNPGMSLLYDIQAVPTVLFFVRGAAQARIVGTASKDAILSQFQLLVPGGRFRPSSPAQKHKP